MTRPEDVRKDVDAIFWSLRLHGIRRFLHQRFWEAESGEADRADRCEAWPRLESVSEHSWHVADIVILLAPHFQKLDVHRCLEMAILHDKLEVITGDADPVGGDGTGAQTHAFNLARRAEKDSEARRALEVYASILRDSAAEAQRQLFHEMIGGESVEAAFVKAIDKLQAFAFVITKKRGNFEDRHLTFTLHYVEKGIKEFPGLMGHYAEMCCRLFADVAKHRAKAVDTVVRGLGLPPSATFGEHQHLWTRNGTSP